MALDVSGRGSSVTIGSTRYSIAAFSTGAAADDCPSSPAGEFGVEGGLSIVCFMVWPSVASFLVIVVLSDTNC